MTNHDLKNSSKGLLTNLDAIQRISPEFNSLSLDIQEVMKQSNDPVFVASLLYKLVKEREDSNRILSELSQKIAKIEEICKISLDYHTKTLSVLAEPDQHIMQLIGETGMVSAQDVMLRLSYKNPNAASQRLNNLVRLGHLKSVRSGRKVVFTKV